MYKSVENRSFFGGFFPNVLHMRRFTMFVVLFAGFSLIRIKWRPFLISNKENRHINHFI